MRTPERARLRRAVAAAAVALAVSTLAGRGEAGERTIVIATAPVAGSYYPAGGALCTLVNATRPRHGLRCLVEGTAGSTDNLDRLRRGEVDFALIQSDWQYLAVRSGHGADRKPFADLRAVFSLHAQPVTLVVHPEAGIAALEDLKGRRVNLGTQGSGVRAVAEALIGALGWGRDDFEEIADLGIDEQVEALCGGRIDAFILPLSHPNGSIAKATDSCDARLVDVAGPAVDRLIADWPFYAPATIPGGLYRGHDRPVKSYGTRATLVTLESVPEEVVYELVRATFDRLDELTRQHAALADLRAEDMVAVGNTADFHAGALRYHREAGWK